MNTVRENVAGDSDMTAGATENATGSRPTAITSLGSCHFCRRRPPSSSGAAAVTSFGCEMCVLEIS